MRITLRGRRPTGGGVGNPRVNRKNKQMGSKKPKSMVVGQGAFKPKPDRKTTRRPR